MLRNLLAGAAALGMMATPALARPVVSPSASKLSLSKAVPADARVSAPSGKSKAAGSGLIVVLVAAAAVIAGIVVVTSSDDDLADSP